MWLQLLAWTETITRRHLWVLADISLSSTVYSEHSDQLNILPEWVFAAVEFRSLVEMAGSNHRLLFLS